MFFEKVNTLCNEKGVSITQMCKDIQVSTGLATGWKNGAIPRRSTVKRIAEYFNKPVMFFYENADFSSLDSSDADAEPPNKNTEDTESQKITDEELKFALWHGEKGITDAQLEAVKRYAAFIAEREKGKS